MRTLLRMDAHAEACHISPMPQAGKHRGWYRPRSVPHFDTPERPQFITFRLADSLPREVAVTRAGEGSQDYRRRIESALDAGAGACWMARPELAEIVRDALMYGCGRTHDLYAYVVMPNHVHVLTVFRDGFRLADAVRDWKGFSARRINAILGREGAFWQKDYFDRFIRDEAHFEHVRFYIENNPVSAGLTRDAAFWPFSSLAQR